MDQAKGSLAGHDYQLAPFLELHISRPFQQITAQSCRQLAHSTHAAWQNHHTQRPKRAAGDRRPHISPGMTVQLADRHAARLFSPKLLLLYPFDGHFDSSFGLPH